MNLDLRKLMQFDRDLRMIDRLVRKTAQIDTYWPPRYVIQLSFKQCRVSEITNKFADIGREYDGIRPRRLRNGYGFRMYFNDEESARTAAHAMCAEAQYNRIEGTYKIKHDVYIQEIQGYHPELIEEGQLSPIRYIPDVDYEPEP